MAPVFAEHIVTFRQVRREFGRFVVYHGIGKDDEYHIRNLKHPWARKDYPHSFLVIRGHIDCHGPEGYGVQRFEEGLVTTELPDYTHAGRYVFKPGPEGVEYYCISAKNRSTYDHQIVNLKPGEYFALPEEQILALNKGSFQFGNVTATAPIIIDSTIYGKTIRAITDCKGVALWQ